MEAFEINKRPMYQAQRPVRDREYRQFIKKLPCSNCSRTWSVDPAHTGPHGMGQKASDLQCIPLCRSCHDEYDAAPLAFCERHKIDIPALVRKLNELYRDIIKGRVA